MLPDRTVELVIGDALRDELRRRGYVVVPALPSPEMISIAAKAPTGTFSPWHHSLGALVPLWCNLLLTADPKCGPLLDGVVGQLRRLYPGGM